MAGEAGQALLDKHVGGLVKGRVRLVLALRQVNFVDLVCSSVKLSPDLKSLLPFFMFIENQW